ncbi:MAG: HNH endonuclease signature motif containing protein [Candidatus Woesearchaeota archaeon]
MGYTYGHKWGEEDIEYLKSNYLTQTNKELAIHFGVSDSSIEHKLKRLGLNRPKEIIGAHISKSQRSNVHLIERRRTLGNILGSLLKENSEYKEKWKLSQKNNLIIQKHRNSFGERMHNNPLMKEKMLEGIRHSQKHKESNRIKSLMILKNPELNEKRLLMMRLTKGSDEHRVKISGEGNSMWKGGLSFEPYSPQFNPLLKSKIRIRDRYICQNCGILEERSKLNIHHIDYNKQNNQPHNLISLCRNCHSKTNTRRKYWEEYFKQKRT